MHALVTLLLLVTPSEEPLRITDDVQAYATNMKRQYLFFTAGGILRDGRQLSLGFFFGDALEEFEKLPAAYAEVQQARSFRIASFGLTTVGTVGMLTGAIGIALPSTGTLSSATPWLVTIGASLIPLIIGSIFAIASSTHLFEAVRLWNNHLLDVAMPQVSMGNLTWNF